ncbi:MAG: hypothetical protein Q8R65_00310 [Polynucleobacter sp.]|nr:hypothetical protein [Polynucleobacter sp.]
MGQIIFHADGALFGFGNLNVNENDGSIYLQLASHGGKYRNEISIHTTGRINYRLVGEKILQETLFVNCLIDIKKTNPIASYRITSLNMLDKVNQKPGDVIIDIPIQDLHKSIFMELQLICASEPNCENEIFRHIHLNTYGIRCVVMSMDKASKDVVRSIVSQPVLIPLNFGLRKQQVDRVNAYLKYKKLRYQLGVSGGLIGPSKNGILEAIYAVPMRDKPRLDIKFADDKYFVVPLTIEPADFVLGCARVKFKVREKRSRRFQKKQLEIVSITLDAEL